MTAPTPAAAPSASGPTHSWLRFLLVVAAVWTVGQVLTQGVSDELAFDHPAQAVAWRGDSADALSQLALRRLAAGDFRHTAIFAGRALELSPLNVAAQSAFGLALERTGEPKRADQVLTIAGKRGWRDAVTQIWLFQHRLLERRYAEGFDRADALLRRTAQFNPFLFRALAVTARDPKAFGQLAAVLRTAPGWREAFLAYLCADSDPASVSTAQAILQSLAAGPTRPTENEVATYLARLVHDQKYEEARSAWSRLSRLPRPASGALYDGDFETAPGPTPFDWSFVSGLGWTPSITQAPGSGHGQALRLDYDGVSQPQSVRQRLVLPAGDHQFSGQVYVEAGSDPGRIGWIVTCEANSEPLARVAVAGRQGQWRAFSAQVHTPAQGCPSQWLQLTADPGDNHDDIVVWFDGLAIAMAPASAPSPATDALFGRRRDRQ